MASPTHRVVQASPLLNLPAELLEIIFKDVYQYKYKTLTRPLCRHLTPLHDRLSAHRFRRVRVWNGPGLEAYIDSLRYRPGLGSSCHSFRAYRSCGSADSLGISAQAVPFLFDSMPNVRIFHLVGEQIVGGFMQYLLEGGDEPPFSLLEELQLDAGDYDGPEVFSLSGIAALAKLLQLKKLSIDIHSDVVETANKISAKKLPKLAALTELVLTQPQSPIGAANLVAACPNLRTLSLSTTSPGRDLKKFFQGLARPFTSVTNLSLSGATAEEGKVDWALPAGVEKLVSVTHLTLGKGCRVVSDAAFRHLKALVALEHLAFEPDTVVAARILRRLVSGRNRVASLRSVVLDHIYAENGRKSPPWGSYRDGRHEYRRDVFPKWTKSMNRQSCQDLIRLARQAGVELRGKTVDALETEVVIERRKRRRAKRWRERYL